MGFFNQLEEWTRLQALSQPVLDNGKRFVANRRLSQSSLSLDGIDFDFSRQLVSDEIIHGLKDYARKINLSQKMDAIFRGEKLNLSEDRPILHAFYRTPMAFKAMDKASDLEIEARYNLDKVKALSEKAKDYESLVHIGMGGSDLGPKLIVDALSHEYTKNIDCYFLSNLDDSGLKTLLSHLNPTKTLVVISSKSFTTLETINNSQKVLSWLGKDKMAFQVFAITSAKDKALSFGIDESNILSIFSGVGGRFSVFSPIGFSIAAAFGYDVFQLFLAGGSRVDDSLKEGNNLALMMALIDFWNVNFLLANSLSFIPYQQRLNQFVPYLQQLMMESNGKTTSRLGKHLSYPTCPIIWGGVGSSSQHSFHQLLMQGSNKTAIDFIKVNKKDNASDILQKQLKAQSDALWFGNEETEKHLAKKIAGHKAHSVVTLDAISPKSLGELLAIYEYRTIYLGFLWDINSFDQPGVELGKKLAQA